MLAEFAVDALAAHRLTRLVTADSITQRWRDALVCHAYRVNGDFGDEPDQGWADYAEGDPNAPKVARLVTCRWCTGLWIAVGVVIARRVAPRRWGYVAR